MAKSDASAGARVALVTGASAGIGQAAARALARRGWRLVLASRSLNLLQALAYEVAGSTETAPPLPLRLDVTDPDAVEACVATALERCGRIDLLVNNAGIGRLDWLERLDPQEGVRAPIDVNLIGAIWMARAVLPSMLERRAGHILNVASLASWIASPTYSVYAATKFGLRGFSDALRREVSHLGVSVSVIYPGAVRTGFAAADLARRRTRLRTPRALVLTPDSVGEAIARLAERPRRSTVLPAVMRPVLWLNVLAPWLVDWLIVRGFVRRERAGGRQELAEEGPGSARG